MIVQSTRRERNSINFEFWSAMGSIKDLGRLLNGLSLIAKELATRSPANEEFQTLFKKALVSATDLAGLTRGQVVRPISNPNPHPNPATGTPSSVVYFTPTPSPSQLDSNSNSSSFSSSSSSLAQPQEEQHPLIHDSETHNIVQSAPATYSVPAFVSSADSLGSDSNGDVVVSSQLPPPPPPPFITKRKPRERRVPSTPFSRALGLVSHLNIVFLSSSSTNWLTAKCNTLL